MINGYTRVCGVIGNPVEHTMSPAIHNSLAESTGQNLAYVPFHVEDGRLGDAVRGAYALNMLGLNITVPYKSDVIPFLCGVDELAAKIGAVNTLVRTEGGFRGYNTDMPGLYRAMQSDGVRVEDREVVILGAGGVARAVAMMLATKGAKAIILVNRTLDRAEKIAGEINECFGTSIASALSLDRLGDLKSEERYLVIQATNVGMHPKVEECVVAEESFFEKIEVGYDLIFNPLETKFMKQVREHGGKAYNGLKMLLYQGIIAYELWTDCRIEEELAVKVYQNMLEQMKK